MAADPPHLDKSLSDRQEKGKVRQLLEESDLVDFCSNDYLGLARSDRLREKVEKALKKFKKYPLGSTGSRLISGNTAFAEALEQELAAFHRAEAGLIFNSGYDANLALFSAVPQRGDTIIYDQYAHASIRDGIRLGLARSYPFAHNDLTDLEKKLKKAAGTIFIAVESVYSMDGDTAPLADIVNLARHYEGHIILDEAHSSGLYGPDGAGMAVEKGVEDQLFARLHTFGKAIGVHGAVVLGSNTLRNYFINFARSFIYTTALPVHTLLTVQCSYRLLRELEQERSRLWKLVKTFRQEAASLDLEVLSSSSPIQGVVIPGNDRVKQVARLLRSAGFDVRPILSPTVPEGKERLRISLHSFNTEQQVKTLVDQLRKIES